MVPRSLFAIDGTLLHCSHKTALMDTLEKLPVHEDNDTGVIQNGEHTEVPMRVSVVDALEKLPVDAWTIAFARSFVRMKNC